MKKFLSIIIALTFSMLIPMQALASNEVIHEIHVLQTNDISDIIKCVQTKSNGLSEQLSLDSKSIDKINKLEFTNLEKTKEIFKSLGVSYSEKSKKQQEISNNLNNTYSIVNTISYLKINSEGKSICISKQQCLNEITESKQIIDTTSSKSSSLIMAGSNSGDKYDYMSLSIIAIYQGNGYYTLGCEYEWLVPPVNRLKDAFSLYSDQFAWESPNEDAYEKVIHYMQETVQENGNVVTVTPIDHATIEDPEIDGDGFFFTWDLPNQIYDDLITITTYNLRAQLWTTARLKYYGLYQQQILVYSAYVHNLIQLTPSYSISSNSFPGVIGGFLSVGTKRYTSPCDWDYYNHTVSAGEI